MVSRTKEEVDQIICWLTGYDQAGLRQQIEEGHDLETFFAQSPGIHPNSALIKGVVCGVRVEEIKDPLVRRIRYLDKLIDELANGNTEINTRIVVMFDGLLLRRPQAQTRNDFHRPVAIPLRPGPPSFRQPS
jgi:hypothetical protein